ncbi:hypothetical protein CI109_100097 [Kwoniella shandongensis]|uniref:Uncharacterized protein n=1 Tax=Kwoniella shandongensis TaxID=1734106 RepID=A0A5M6BQN1_9TREE|nr:uncharacterized protein CI109_007246 [Kwoniella shandongensis]KAA5524411.1 hypothetical protein CI109_007246 [Kwoniella shandongensis]
MDFIPPPVYKTPQRQLQGTSSSKFRFGRSSKSKSKGDGLSSQTMVVSTTTGPTTTIIPSTKAQDKVNVHIRSASMSTTNSGNSKMTSTSTSTKATNANGAAAYPEWPAFWSLTPAPTSTRPKAKSSKSASAKLETTTDSSSIRSKGKTITRNSTKNSTSTNSGDNILTSPAYTGWPALWSLTPTPAPTASSTRKLVPTSSNVSTREIIPEDDPFAAPPPPTPTSLRNQTLSQISPPVQPTRSWSEVPKATNDIRRPFTSTANTMRSWNGERERVLSGGGSTRPDRQWDWDMSSPPRPTPPSHLGVKPTPIDYTYDSSDVCPDDSPTIPELVMFDSPSATSTGSGEGEPEVFDQSPYMDQGRGLGLVTDAELEEEHFKREELLRALGLMKDIEEEGSWIESRERGAEYHAT